MSECDRGGESQREREQEKNTAPEAREGRVQLCVFDG